MSVVVATRDEQGYVHLASDSMASTNFTDTQLDICKINQTTDEDVVIGNVGNMSLTLLKFSPILPPMKYRPKIMDEEFFLTYVRQELIALIKMVDKGATKEKFYGQLLIAYGKQLYVMDSGYAMYPVHQQSYAIGSGEFHANSSMAILNAIDGLTIREKLMSAVNVTGKHVSSVGNNIYYINTKDLNLMRLEKKEDEILIIEPEDTNSEDDNGNNNDNDNNDNNEDIDDDSNLNKINELIKEYDEFKDFSNVNNNNDNDDITINLDDDDVIDRLFDNSEDEDEDEDDGETIESLTDEEIQNQIDSLQSLLNLRAKLKSNI